MERTIRLRGAELRVLESCTYRFLLDMAQHRYARVPHGLRLDIGDPIQRWEPFYEVDVDADARTFTLVMNAERSQFLTAELHGEKCSCLVAPTAR